MRLYILSFTDKGYVLANQLREQILAACVVTDCFVNCMGASHTDKTGYVKESLTEWSGRRFHDHDGMLFIGAAGIAVRGIAPHIADKLHDSPVLCMDELGQYVIPLLSGHVGGANEIARKLSELTGAIPVITTATDLNHSFAVDLFAKRNHLQILNRDGIASVSSKSLRGEKIRIFLDPNRVHGELPGNQIELVERAENADVIITTERTYEMDSIEERNQPCLYLKPREYVMGIGCKKGKSFDELKAFVQEQLDDLSVSAQDVLAVGSHILKQNERGLQELCNYYGIPFITYDTETLKKVEGTFSESSFVEATTGVDCICERAAMAAAGKGELIVPKVAQNGMTFALVKRNWEIDFEEA